MTGGSARSVGCGRAGCCASGIAGRTGKLGRERVEAWLGRVGSSWAGRRQAAGRAVRSWAKSVTRDWAERGRRRGVGWVLGFGLGWVFYFSFLFSIYSLNSKPNSNKV
jgi:hypothetical protein